MAECAICLEPIKSNRSVLPCGHVFHSACMKKMIKNNATYDVLIVRLGVHLTIFNRYFFQLKKLLFGVNVVARRQSMFHRCALKPRYARGSPAFALA